MRHASHNLDWGRLAGCSINPGALTPGEPQPAPSPPGSNIALLTERHQPRRANNKRGAMLAQAGKADEALADCNKAISLGANYGTRPLRD